MQLPLPFQLDHVNVWLIDGGAGGWTLVDTGFDDARTRDAWEGVFTGALDGRPITRVVATHFHPDHIGLADWLVERWGATFATGLSEWLLACALALDTGPRHVDVQDAFYRRAGLGADALELLRSRGNGYARVVRRVPATLTRLRAGDTLTIGERVWRVIGGGGHTPEPVGLFCADPPMFISGDQVLPRISPNISVWPNEPDADPLRDFLDGFAGLEALPPDVLVLPSHGRPFVGLHRRLADLRAHHSERLEEIVTACAEPLTAFDVAKVLFARDLDAHQSVFALGEALAHLNHLIAKGRISRTAGTDGVDRYRAS